MSPAAASPRARAFEDAERALLSDYGVEGASATATRATTRRDRCAGFDVVRTGMRMPGWRRAMVTHLNAALAKGRARPENLFSDDDPKRCAGLIRAW